MQHVRTWSWTDKDLPPLTDAQISVLELFWDTRRRTLRKDMPESVLLFLSSDGEELAGFVQADAMRALGMLSDKDYIVLTDKPSVPTLGSDRHFALTAQGVEYLRRHHPYILARWQSAVQFTSPVLTLFAAIVGFVASVFGLVQFIAWLLGWSP